MIGEKQLEFRKGKVGSSDSAAAVGASRFKTPARLFAELTGKIELEPIKETSNVLGNGIEIVLQGEYIRQTGRRCYTFPDDESWVYEGNENFIAHPDATSPGDTRDDDRIVEFKTVGPTMAFDYGTSGDFNEDVPVYNRCQLFHQILCSNGRYRKADILAYFGGGDVRIWSAEFSDETIEAYRVALEEFWGYVERDEYPPLKAKDSELMKCLYEGNETNPITATREIQLLGKQYYQLSNEIKRKNAELDLMKAEIQLYMNEHDLLVDENGYRLFTWKRGKPQAPVDWKSLAQVIADSIDPKAYEDKLKAFTGNKPGTRTFNCKIKDTYHVG